MFNAIRMLWGISHNVHEGEGWNVLNVSPRGDLGSISSSLSGSLSELYNNPWGAACAWS